MHEVAIYDGVVLGRRSYREADLVVEVLTPAGLLHATARSARVEKSKLRYGLQVLSRGRYSFVRGKAQWRLTGATDVSRGFTLGTPAVRAARGRVAQLLLRLVAGVDPSPELYKVVVEGFEALGSGAPVQPVEVVLVLRVLACLGYLPHTEALAPFIEGGFSIELSAKALEAKALLVRTINESLKATGL